MSKSLFVKSKAVTPQDQLREQLTQLEALIGQLGHGLGEEALSIPPLFDRITAGLDELHTAGLNTPAETSRLDYASSELQRKAATFLHEIGGAKTLRNARNGLRLNPVPWWWSLEQWVAEKRRTWLRRWLVGGATVVLLLAILSFVYRRFLAPDPSLLASIRHQQAAESLAQAQDWAGALAEVEQALAVLPNDPDGLIMKGILQQKLGESGPAEQTFAAAEARLGSRQAFLTERAQQFLRINESEAALVDAQELVAAQPDSAMGYLVLGQAHTSLKHYDEAIAALQQASDLADRQGKGEIAAAARIQLGTLMQMISVPTATSP